MTLKDLLEKYGNREVEESRSLDKDEKLFRVEFRLKLTIVKLTELERLYLKKKREEKYNIMFCDKGKWKIVYHNRESGEPFDETKAKDVPPELKFEGISTECYLLPIKEVLYYDEGEWKGQ